MRHDPSQGGEGVVGVRYANPRRLAGARNAWDVVKAVHGAACDLQNFGAGRKPKFWSRQADAHFQILI